MGLVEEMMSGAARLASECGFICTDTAADHWDGRFTREEGAEAVAAGYAVEIPLEKCDRQLCAVSWNLTAKGALEVARRAGGSAPIQWHTFPPGERPAGYKPPKPPKTKRSRRARGPAIKTVVSGAFDGTEEIVAAVVKESTGIESWRPVRAAAIMAMVGEERSPIHHRWMTAVEFSTFILRFFPPGTQRAARLAPELGIAKGRRRAILDGAPISKAEAFACAHYATGLPLPIVAGDTAVFATWATERFGAMRAITATLNLSREYISDRIKGYDINAKVGRVERLPDAGLIRAMDWCWRVGPFSPYGDRLPAPPFPSQGAGPCC